MNNSTLTPKKQISCGGTIYDHNQVMQILGKQIIDLPQDDHRSQEYNAALEGVRKEIESKGVVSMSDIMRIGYTLGIIHGKQMEREKKS